MKSIRLEQVVNVATLFVCLSVSAAAIHYIRSSARGTGEGAAPAAQARVEPGDELALPSGLVGRPVLVVYLAPTCHFCTESMPFYRTLAQQKEIRSGAVGFIVASSKPEAEVKPYLISHGLFVKAFADATRLGIKTRATPTVALVNEDGTVRSAWTGLLDTQAQLNVQAAIGDLAKTNR